EISISQPFQVFAQLTHGFLLSTQSSIERSGWSHPLAIAAARKAAERSSSAALGAREGVDSGQASSPPTSAAAACSLLSCCRRPRRQRQGQRPGCPPHPAQARAT